MKVYTEMSKLFSRMAKIEARHFFWPGSQLLYWLGSAGSLARIKIRLVLTHGHPGLFVCFRVHTYPA